MYIGFTSHILNADHIAPDLDRHLTLAPAMAANYANRNSADESEQDQFDGTQSIKAARTILIVEDDDDVRAIVEELLIDNGFRILSACNGPEALKILRSAEPIDLLFTDVVMPGGMNGPEVAAAAGTIRPQLKVLFTSGYLGHSLAGGGRAALGPSPFLPKPYRPAKLISTIIGLIGA